MQQSSIVQFKHQLGEGFNSLRRIWTGNEKVPQLVSQSIVKPSQFVLVIEARIPHKYIK